MTLPQLMLELGMDRGKPVSQVNPTLRRHEVLDDVCERFQLKPASLLTRPAEQVASMIRDVLGNVPVDVSNLRSQLIEYVNAKG